MQPQSIQETDLFTHVHWGESTLETLTIAHHLCYSWIIILRPTPEFTVKQWEQKITWIQILVSVGSQQSVKGSFIQDWSCQNWKTFFLNLDLTFYLKLDGIVLGVNVSILFLPNGNQKGSWQSLYFLFERLFWTAFFFFTFPSKIWVLFGVSMVCTDRNNIFGSWVLIS